MSDRKQDPRAIQRFDRPSENLVAKNAKHAPWYDDNGPHSKDKSKHRHYHSLFEDLMN